ncbi:hypothetical protein ACIQGZ_05735 [Streptomyces sp. NPDC092296]
MPTWLYNQIGSIAQDGTAPGVGPMVGLAAYFVVFGALAAWLYRRDTKQA